MDRRKTVSEPNGLRGSVLAPPASMKLRPYVYALAASLVALVPQVAFATAMTFTPSIADGYTVYANQPVTVKCSGTYGGMTFAPSTVSFSVSDGSSVSPASTAVTLDTSSTWSASTTWTTPSPSTVTVTCVDNYSRSLSQTVNVVTVPVMTVSVTADPSGPVAVGGKVTLTATAANAPSNTVNYFWTLPTGEGTLSSTTGASVTWTAPTDWTGAAEIDVTAVSGQASVTQPVFETVVFSVYDGPFTSQTMLWPTRIATTPNGYVFATATNPSTGQPALYILTRAGAMIAAAGVGAGLNSVAAGGGTVYVGVNRSIVKVDATTGRITGSIATNSSAPDGLAVDVANKTIWAVFKTGAVAVFGLDGTMKAMMTDVTDPGICNTTETYSLRNAIDVAVDTVNNKVWVLFEQAAADPVCTIGAPLIHSFDRTTFASANTALLSWQREVYIAGGLATDGQGRLYVSDTLAGVVMVFGANGTQIGQLGTDSSGNWILDYPRGISLLQTGTNTADVLVANSGLGRVDRFGSGASLPACYVNGKPDSDCDGLPDEWEVAMGLNPKDPTDAFGDKDGDGLLNIEEYKYGTSAILVDTDGDGIKDRDEILAGTDPTGANNPQLEIQPSTPAESGPGLVRVTAVVTGTTQTCSTSWKQTGGPAAVSLLGASTLTPSFVARLAGTYALQGVAQCGGVSSKPAIVSVIVNNVAPVADAGRITVVRPGKKVHLSAARSSDANGDAISFVWDQTFGAALAGTTSGADLPVRARTPGYYVFSLSAADPARASSAAETALVVADETAPTAMVASAILTGQVGTPASLDASASVRSPDATFAWDQLAGPSQVTLAAAPVASFTPDQPGRYSFRVSVQDSGLWSPPAFVEVFVADANGLPVAGASAPQVVAVNVPVTLDGSVTAGSADTYAWRQVEGPAAGLTSADRLQATVVPFVPGYYVFELAVAGGATPALPVRVAFEARSGGTAIPVARAQGPAEAISGEYLLLDGRSSTGASSYRWTQVAGPWIPIDPTDPAPRVRPVVAGEYAFELEVADRSGVRSAPARVAFTVKGN